MQTVDKTNYWQTQTIDKHKLLTNYWQTQNCWQMQTVDKNKLLTNTNCWQMQTVDKSKLSTMQTVDKCSTVSKNLLNWVFKLNICLRNVTSWVTHSFIHSRYFYSTSLSPLLLRGTPNYIDTVSELTRWSATCIMSLLLTVEWDSNLWPSKHTTEPPHLLLEPWSQCSSFIYNILLAFFFFRQWKSVFHSAAHELFKSPAYLEAHVHKSLQQMGTHLRRLSDIAHVAHVKALKKTHIQKNTDPVQHGFHSPTIMIHNQGNCSKSINRQQNVIIITHLYSASTRERLVRDALDPMTENLQSNWAKWFSKCLWNRQRKQRQTKKAMKHKATQCKVGHDRKSLRTFALAG